MLTVWEVIANAVVTCGMGTKVRGKLDFSATKPVEEALIKVEEGTPSEQFGSMMIL